ncbi:hypothetical protein KBC75_05950 [Candidatus Shapirobacteria bacterium]|nr:hypothetical protein [Candidatus Shapirobacteria bacterium]
MKTASYPNRTQISLSPEMKRVIEEEGVRLGEGLSEYLRKAALMRMAVEYDRKNDLKTIANLIVGSVPASKSGWKGVNLIKWQRSERRGEDEHRS